MRVARILGAGIGAAALGVATIAAAGPFDVEGFGPTGIAEVNARAARADDGTATFYNPGGLALGHGVRTEIAPTLGVSGLSAQGKTKPLEDPFGIAVAFDATIPLTGVLKDRIRFGFGAYLPPTTALRLIARPSDEPLFPYYDNRTQRLVLIPALAVKIMDGLGVGLGLDVLGGVTGPASVRPGASGAPESRIDLQATTSFSVHAGVRWDPVPWVRLALAFRQRFAIPADVTTQAELGGVPLNLAVVTHGALYDPTTFIAAASFDVGRATVEIDASYAVWSAWEGPFAFVHAELPGLNINSALPASPARDVVSVRGAGAFRLDLSARSTLWLRVGAGFEPTMLKSDQQGRTNLVDGDKILAGLGASLSIRDLGRKDDGAPVLRALRIGLGASSQIVLPFEQDKRACVAAPCPADTVAGPDAKSPSKGITNPGYPKLEGGGAFWSMSLGVGVDLVKNHLALSLVFAAIAASATARADAPGMFGLGARAAGIARAGVAAGDPVDAPRENAAAAATPGLRLRIGYGYAALGLTFDGGDAGVEHASGVDLAAQYGFAAGPVDLGFAFALHLPDQYLARIGFRPATEPQFVLYEAPLQRVTFDLALAIRYRWLSIGGGVAMGLSAGGDGTRFDLRQDAHGAGADAAIDIALPYRFAPIVGVRADLGRVAIAAAFRGAMALDLRLDSYDTVALQDNPLNGSTTVHVSGSSGYDPAVVTFGARVRVAFGLSALASIEYSLYRATPPPVADVQVDVRLGTTPGLREARFVEPRFRDTLTPRVGLELASTRTDSPEKKGDHGSPAIPRWAARVGYAVAPSPVPDQIGFTTYADATRHEIAAGFGFHVGRFAGVDFTIDAAGQCHLLAPRAVQKESLSLPYARYRVGGNILHGALTLEAAWR